MVQGLIDAKRYRPPEVKRAYDRRSVMEARVREAGFEHISRTFLEGRFPSELVLARKPTAG